MNEQIEKYIADKKAQERARFEKKRDEHLIKLGFFDKEYSPDGKYSKEYDQYDFDEASQTERYYKIVPFKVTDEEYEELVKVIKKGAVNEASTSSNGVATTLTVIAGIIFFIGFIVGIFMGTEAKYDLFNERVESEFALDIAFEYWGIYFVIGMLFLGFAEIIKLLQAIKDKK